MGGPTRYEHSTFELNRF